ncbi:TraR/DksA C4-type zinc finger protein [Salinicola sp. CPA57]|uniref:TraR/DksA C4-type zinc finger protein n=1 Tax=Salinicola sp. CPA57 TaxID=1949080 RepID=UPI000DA16F88|nr:TraR/DksA C4-type zinc finger protein [Salinicola sp. CPA57]
MADNADIARDLIDETVERALAQRNGPRRHVVPMDDECVDCGDDIPAARRERMPYALRCFECQSRKEGRR